MINKEVMEYIDYHIHENKGLFLAYTEETDNFYNGLMQYATSTMARQMDFLQRCRKDTRQYIANQLRGIWKNKKVNKFEENYC